MGFQIRDAVRKNLPLKIGLAGFSGAGKTFSALKLARGLAPTGKIVVVDTENRRSDYYADLVGGHKMVPFDAPYSPTRYVEAIKMLEKDFDVIILDSASHEWEGEGGCLEMSKNGNKGIVNWGIVTPLHKRFTDAILNSPAHIIATIRQKKDFSLSEGENGRTKISKVGTKAVQRDTFEYEFALMFEIGEDHKAVVTKDNTRLFSDPVPFFITEEVGERLKIWNETGAAVSAADRVAAAIPAAPPTRTQGQATSLHLSDKQVALLEQIAMERNWSDDALALYVQNQHKVSHFTEIGFNKYDKVLADLKKGPEAYLAWLSGQKVGAQ